MWDKKSILKRRKEQFCTKVQSTLLGASTAARGAVATRNSSKIIVLFNKRF